WGCRRSCWTDTAPLELRVQARGKPVEREQTLGVEEEGELDDLAVPEFQHLQRPRIEATPRVARLVLSECDRAIGRRDGDELRAAAPDPGAVPPGEDVVAAGQPHVERRHRLPGVLLDQCCERLEVVLLECGDI